jgi:NAD(P)H-dependent flavin oxidoreductase YrpB (nitropropane dioxygenase family)
MLTTPFTTLVGCSVPVQQAGMGGVATPELAAAVADAGGLGMLGGVRLPAPFLADALDHLRQSTRGCFGVNFLIPFLDHACLEIAATRARVVEFFFGDPVAALVRTVHPGGALAAWQVGSADEAQAAVDAGCDFIVVQGVEAGGHVRGRIGLLPLLDEVLAVVKVPVVAAGGIGTARGMAAALAAGASAVRVGTRFVAAVESAAHPQYKAALIQARPEDTVLTEAFSANWPHAPHRVLRSCVAAAGALSDGVVGHAEIGGQMVAITRFMTPAPIRTTTGKIEAMALYAGESVGAVRSVQPAADILHELADGAERLLAHWDQPAVESAKHKPPA